MAEKTDDRKKEGLSWRWKIAAGAGLLLILGALLWRGFWAAAGIAFLVFLVLAYGKPYERYRKFIYRAVMPAGAIILTVSFLLDALLPDTIPNPVTRLFFSFAMAVPVGILPVFLLIEIYGLARLHWVTALSPDVDKNKALALLRSFYLGLNYPMMIVENGQAVTTKEGGPGGFLQKVGGPGLLFVNHGNAVVLEWGGKFTQVATGGVKFLKLYERPRAVVDLRRQQKILPVNNVYTRDGVLLSFEITLWYQIRRMKGSDATSSRGTDRSTEDKTQLSPRLRQPLTSLSLWRRGLVCLASILWSLAGQGKLELAALARPPDSGSSSETTATSKESPDQGETIGQPDYTEIAMQESDRPKPLPQNDYFAVAHQDVINAVYNVDDWRKGTELMAGHILRDVIAERNLDAVYEYDRTQGQFLPRAEIRQAVLGRLNQFLENEQWGVEVVWVDIGSVAIPESASKRMLEKWLAEWESEIAVLQKRTTILRGEGEAAALSTQETARARASMQMINMIFQAIQESEGLSMPDGFDKVIELRLIDALEKMAAEHMNGVILPSDLLGILDSRRHFPRESRLLSDDTSKGDGTRSEKDAKPASGTARSGNGASSG